MNSEDAYLHAGDDTWLRKLVVRIDADGSVGTGFFVSDGRVLTCAHVVRTAYVAGNRPTVSWQGTSVIAEFADVADSEEYPDVALLKVPWSGHPTAIFDDRVAPYHQLYAFGYTDDAPTGDSLAGRMEGPSGELSRYSSLPRPKYGQARVVHRC